MLQYKQIQHFQKISFCWRISEISSSNQIIIIQSRKDKESKKLNFLKD